MERLGLKKIARAGLLAGAFAISGAANAAIEFSTYATVTLGDLASATAVDTWTVGNLRLGNFSFSGTSGDYVGTPPPVLSDVVTLTQSGNTYTFNYATPPGGRTGSGIFNYTAEIFGSTTLFLHHAYDGMTGGETDGGPVNQSISMTSAGFASPGTTTGTAAGGISSPIYFSPMTLGPVSISTDWNIPAGEFATDMYNSIHLEPVPAPLPILGALAAFGWSRRLRRSIHESKKPGQAASGDMSLAS